MSSGGGGVGTLAGEMASFSGPANLELVIGWGRHMEEKSDDYSGGP